MGLLQTKRLASRAPFVPYYLDVDKRPPPLRRRGRDSRRVLVVRHRSPWYFGPLFRLRSVLCWRGLPLFLHFLWLGQFHLLPVLVLGGAGRDGFAKGPSVRHLRDVAATRRLLRYYAARHGLKRDVFLDRLGLYAADYVDGPYAYDLRMADRVMPLRYAV